MVEETKFFKRIHEIDRRPGFDPEAAITLDNFQSLIGEYHFDEEVTCQVKKADGNCGQKHLHGWVGKIKGGQEGLIGGHCASKYFNADQNFARERSRVRRELNIKNYLERLCELLSDRDAFLTQLDTEVSRLRFVGDSIRAIRKALPRSVIHTLRDMAKTGNRAAMIQIQYIEKDEDGKKQVTWIDQSIGAIAGVGIWLESRTEDVSGQLNEIRSAAQEAEANRDVGERRLKRWLDILSELPRCASKIDNLQKDFDNFATFDNLKRLCYVVRNHDEQVQTASYALTFNGVVDPSSNKGKHLLNEMNAEIRNAAGGRNFRVA